MGNSLEGQLRERVCRGVCATSVCQVGGWSTEDQKSLPRLPRDPQGRGNCLLLGPEKSQGDSTGLGDIGKSEILKWDKLLSHDMEVRCG